MLNRRKFLRYVFMGTGVVSIGYIGRKTGTSTFDYAVSRILAEDLQGLRIKPADIQAYCAEVSKNRFKNFHFAAVQLICLHHMNPFKTLPAPFRAKYNSLRTEIVSDFLLSTDFFYNGMDVEKDITYSGQSYNAYNSPCANPFSGLYYENTLV